MLDIFNEETYSRYIIKYKTPKGRKGKHEFTDYKTAVEVFSYLTYNITIKSAKLYQICNNKKILLKKFKNIKI